MKKNRLIIAAALCISLAASCDWFRLDNQEGYNASVHGTIKDSKTGEAVLSEIYGSSSVWWSSITTGYMKIVELNWDAESQQTWNVKNNGTYRNNLVFAGDYRMETYDANYYPVTTEFSLKKGDNTVDFTVTPYARVLDHKISYDASTKKIEATVTVEASDPSKTPVFSEIRLCCYTDSFVGSGLNNCKYDSGAVARNVTPGTDGRATVTLSIDTQNSANVSEFKYEREHYVRLAVCAAGQGVNTSSRYNFSPTYRLTLDGSSPVEYNEW